jgi:hypothetical protein
VDVDLIPVRTMGADPSERRKGDLWNFEWTAPFEAGSVLWLVRMTANKTPVHEELIRVEITEPDSEKDPFMEILGDIVPETLHPGDVIVITVRLLFIDDLSKGILRLDDGGMGGEFDWDEDSKTTRYKVKYTVPEEEEVTIRARFIVDGALKLTSYYELYVEPVEVTSRINEEDQEEKIDEEDIKVKNETDDQKMNLSEEDSDDRSDKIDPFMISTGILAITCIVLIAIVVFIVIKNEHGRKSHFEDFYK